MDEFIEEVRDRQEVDAGYEWGTMATEEPGDLAGVDVAFEFVIPRYQMSQQRFEAGQTRITQIAVLIPTAFFAGLAFVGAAAEEPDFPSGWLITAALLGGLAMVVAWVARFL